MLWASADKLRASMDAAEYKHIVLGLIFLKYISDSFQAHRMQLTLRSQHHDLRADFIMANSPFNISDWWHPSLEGDPRWVYDTPPQGNANYAWLQHILFHLKPNGRADTVHA
ncbi:MAG: N-6 DNA methylase [Pelodictyon phaeoclathratiforme]